MVHETGHGWFALRDEFDYFVGCETPDANYNSYTGGEPSEVNITKNKDRATLKWGNLVDPKTAVPTQSNPNCSQCIGGESPVARGVVGLFEGAGYYRCGLYRSQGNKNQKDPTPNAFERPLMPTLNSNSYIAMGNGSSEPRPPAR